MLTYFLGDWLYDQVQADPVIQDLPAVENAGAGLVRAEGLSSVLGIKVCEDPDLAPNMAELRDDRGTILVRFECTEFSQK